MKSSAIACIFAIGCFISCAADDRAPESQNPVPQNPDPELPETIRYLALGDSYTIGQSVCATCRFPEQLKSQLEGQTGTNVDLEIIATTGWTTTNLISAIASQNPTPNKDLVTLLIGVNNQYQHKPFSLYQSEFPQLVNTAIALAQGEKANVIVVSIPDYAYTPYGQQSSDPGLISSEIDQYNAFAQEYCQDNGIVFVNITDITRNGLDNPDLVASDGLHPSSAAYAQFVMRLLPKALQALNH